MKNYFNPFNYENKKIIKTFILLVLWLVLIAMSSCIGSKKFTDSKTFEKDKTEVSNVKKEEVTKTEPIKDNIIIQAPKSDNVEAMRLFSEMMSKMNTYKSSGNNSYKSEWDSKNMQLMIEFIIASTENKNTSSNISSVSEKTFEQNLNEYIKNVVIPWWGYVIVVVLLWPYISPVISLIFKTLPISSLLLKK